jgi:N-acetylneuraminic acid mutarotase
MNYKEEKMIFLLSFSLLNLLPAYQWESIPSPSVKAYYHTVVYDPLKDFFFIIGGDSTGRGNNMDICLAFDPKTDDWKKKTSMSVERRAHAASYRNGFIHVLCGVNKDRNRITNHEIYDINRDSWDSLAPAPVPVSTPALVTWEDSLLYLIGGFVRSGNTISEVYYYDPSTDSWHQATSLPRPFHAGGVKIKGDSIYIVGGGDGSAGYSNILLGEINPDNPAEINWSWGKSLPISSNYYNGFTIKGNKSYMIGGAFNNGTNKVWEYDIFDENWTSLPDYPTNIIMRGTFAERIDGPDSLGIVYCFMGDTSDYWGHHPTDKCYKLIKTAEKKDVGMYAINSPISDTTVGTLASISGTVKNYGTVPCSFETRVNILDPDSTLIFTNVIQIENLASLNKLDAYFGSLRLEKEGSYNVKMFTYTPNDVNTSNDTLTVIFNCYSEDSICWQKIPSPNIKAYAHTVVYDPDDDLFFIMGGDSTGRRTNMDICLAFDPETNTWEKKAPMSIAKRGHSATYKTGLIHVFCGVNNNEERITKHEVYDIASNSWDTAAPAPIKVSTPGVVTWRDSLIYFMGGFVRSGDTRTEVYYYDPSTDSWHTATSLPRPFHAGGEKIKGDSIYIVGGGDGSATYSNILLGEINPDNPAEINWSWGDTLPMSGNYNNGLAIKNNNLYLIGGAFNMETTNAWAYNIENKKWTSLPEYPINCVSRGDFAERRDAPNSLEAIYCFMGDTSSYSTREPTDKCYILRGPNIQLYEDDRPEQAESHLKENSVVITNDVFLTNEIGINCNFLESSDFTIHIYDISGREILSRTEKNVSGEQYKISIDKNIKNGVYFIGLETDEIVSLEKFILIR